MAVDGGDERMGRGRMTLALHNSYDPVRLAEAHRRALARAAPVAQAFDCNVAAMGFPFDKGLRTPLEVAEWLATTTSIGEDGGALLELAKKGRFLVLELPKRGMPPQLGTVVGTTSKPWEGRAVDPRWAAERLAEGQSLCLVFGLGPHGLPKDVLGLAEHHLDVTRRRIALETCTAIGAVPAAIAEALGALEAASQPPARRSKGP
jgi:hypothetical protein